MSIYPDFQLRDLSLLGTTRQVFSKGKGPAVVVIHEIPGLYPAVAEFGRRVAERGFSVYMPSLFGVPGKPFSFPYVANSMVRGCVSKEFEAFATRKNSPITAWVRDLCRFAHEEAGGIGVGAVGMCFTGGFALALMADERLRAPVLSQPSLPFAITSAQKRDLGIDDDTLACVKRRAESGIPVMGLRFTGDLAVPNARFERLRQELGDKFIAVEIDSSPGNPHGISRAAHSVLTKDRVDQPGHPTADALERVLTFFEQQLKPAPAV